METIKALMTRRSIRAWTSEPVSAAKRKTILEAAMNAPSAADARPWHFVTMDDPVTIRKFTGLGGTTAGRDAGRRPGRVLHGLRCEALHVGVPRRLAVLDPHADAGGDALGDGEVAAVVRERLGDDDAAGDDERDADGDEDDQ